MRKIAKVSELKAKLSRYLDQVKGGEEVLITHRGTPVAKLVPVTPAAGDDARRLGALERRGSLRRGAGQLPPDFWDWPRPQDAEGSVLAALLEERASGR